MPVIIILHLWVDIVDLPSKNTYSNFHRKISIVTGSTNYFKWHILLISCYFSIVAKNIGQTWIYLNSFINRADWNKFHVTLTHKTHTRNTWKNRVLFPAFIIMIVKILMVKLMSSPENLILRRIEFWIDLLITQKIKSSIQSFDQYLATTQFLLIW